MGDLREKLDRVNIKDLLAIPQFVCAIPFATLLKRKRKDMYKKREIRKIAKISQSNIKYKKISK